MNWLEKITSNEGKVEKCRGFSWKKKLTPFKDIQDKILDKLSLAMGVTDQNVIKLYEEMGQNHVWNLSWYSETIKDFHPNKKLCWFVFTYEAN